MVSLHGNVFRALQTIEDLQCQLDLDIDEPDESTHKLGQGGG